MKIIQISASDHGGGVETVVRLHHNELRRTGHDAQLLVGKKRGADEDTHEIPFRRGPKGVLRASRWAQQTFGLENLYSPSFRDVESSFAFEPDVLHLHSLHGAGGYAELRFVEKLSRKYPTVITLHDFWLMTGHCGYPLECPGWLKGCGSCPDLNRYPAISKDGTRWNFKQKKKVFRRSDIDLIVPSQWLKTQVKRSPILGRLDANVVYNPIDSDVFTSSSDDDRPGELGIEKGDFVVLMIANNLANIYKGIDDGIQALKLVKHRPTKVLVIGRAVEQIAAQIDLPTYPVPYTKSEHELARYYRIADLLLMPSRCETFGLVAAEAMACGTPVISFDEGALPEVIGDEDTGIVVSSRDVTEFARQIDLLAENCPRRKKMSAMASERITNLFPVDAHSRGVTNIYKKAISQFAETPPNESDRQLLSR